MKKLLNQLMLCATLVFMSISMSSCLTTMGLMLIWLDDDEPQQQQQAPVEKIYSDFEFHVKEVKKGTLDGDFINKLTMKGDGGGIQYISSDPSVATIDASGRVHILKTGTTSITATIEDRGNYIYNNHAATYTILVTEGYTYVEYDPTTKKFKTNVLESADKYTLLSSLGSGDITLNETSKPYLANSDITINGTITFANDAKLILVDGCVVTVNGKVTVSSAIDDINIYGQTWMNGSGLLNVKSTTDDAINCNNLQLHSCYVRVETTGSGKKGIYAANYIGFYGCLAQGNGGPDGDGIFCGGNMDIVESFIVGSGGSNNAGNGGHGIVYAGLSNFNVGNGTIITATGGTVSGAYEDQGGDGLVLYANTNIVLDGGTLMARGGCNSKRHANNGNINKDGYGLYLGYSDAKRIYYKSGAILIQSSNPNGVYDDGHGIYAYFQNASEKDIKVCKGYEVFETLTPAMGRRMHIPYFRAPADGW